MVEVAESAFCVQALAARLLRSNWEIATWILNHGAGVKEVGDNAPSCKAAGQYERETRRGIGIVRDEMRCP